MSNITSQVSSVVLGALVVILAIAILVVIGAVISLNAHRIAGWLVKTERVVPGRRNITGERQETLQRLYASLITALAIVLVMIGVLRIFVDSAQIIWIIGLFSAGFGLGARVLVSDLIAGTTYIFSNTFAIGEKVEFSVGANYVDGMVEDVNMRSTLVRARSGELFTVPNGEIGVIRNFTRAPFSGAQISIAVPTDKLDQAIRTLQSLGEQATALIPEQIEPWHVLVTTESIGRTTVVTVQAKFAFGQAAALKPRMVELIHNGLTEAGILVDE